MNNLITAILPKDVLCIVFEYLLETILFNGNKFSKYEYVINTFAKNIDYMKNTRVLESGTEELVLKKIEAEKMREKEAGIWLIFGEKIKSAKLDYDIANYHDIFVKIMKSSNMGMIKCLHNVGDKLYKLYELACEFGCDEILRYFTRTFLLTLRDFTEYSKHGIICYKDCIMNAVINGHLSTLEYITQTFKLTLGDIAKNNYFCNVFTHAFEKGDLQIIEYLTQTFKPTIKNLNVIYAGFRVAIVNNDLGVLKYLVDTFQLPSAHERNEFNVIDIIDIYKWVSAERNVDDSIVVGYLELAFGLKREMFREPPSYLRR